MDGPLLIIDRTVERTVVAQLVESLRRGILEGRLHAGDPVPSTRALARELGVARSSVVAAYDQLAGEGYLELRQGAATRVAANTQRSPADRPEAPSPTGRATSPDTQTALRGRPAGPATTDLSPGIPSTSRIDERAWRAAWRAAAAAPPGDSPPALGLPQLRAAIAEHLRHARGVSVDADDIVVAAGTSEALVVVAHALRARSGAGPRIGVESPGYRNGRLALLQHGAELVPLPIARDGLDVSAVTAGAAEAVDAIMVTPSHQYPLGGRLPVADRLALLAWAEEAGAFVVEDDYDSEFRHTGAPLPALASLDGGERVVLVGSFSKVLTPWLRLGYLVLPRHPGLRAALVTARDHLANPVAGPVQLAMAHLISSGALRRHIAASSREYRHRRELVLTALAPLERTGARLRALDGGLHAVLELPDQTHEHELVARLAADGVIVAALSSYSATTGAHPARAAPARPPISGASGIVIGYAAVGDLALTAALDRIAAIARDILAADPRA